MSRMNREEHYTFGLRFGDRIGGALRSKGADVVLLNAHFDHCIAAGGGAVAVEVRLTVLNDRRAEVKR